MLAAAFARAAGTKIVEGRLEAAPEDGAWILRVGAETVPMEPDKKTRFWHDRAACDAKAFKVGDTVVARISPADTPATLREISDKASWAWLDAIRKGVREGTVKGFDGKRLTVAFPDSTEMPYRATEKSKILLAGKEATLGDLKAGQKLWLKGRTLPTLDVWLVVASDRIIVAPPKKAASKGGGRKSQKAKALPASGRLEGDVDVHYRGMGMFDMTSAEGAKLHVNYFPATAFTLNGAKSGPDPIATGRHVVVSYKRDGFGRINAAKVDIR